MQLLAIAKRPVIKKYGCNEILRTLMTQLNQLEQVRLTCIIYDDDIDYNNNSIVLNLLNTCSTATHKQDNNFNAMMIIIYLFCTFYYLHVFLLHLCFEQKVTDLSSTSDSHFCK